MERTTVTYIRFDFTETVPGTGAQWGGASFFEGTQTPGPIGAETFFAGDPGQASVPPQYGIDTQNDALNGALRQDAVFSGVAINNADTHDHRMRSTRPPRETSANVPNVGR